MVVCVVPASPKPTGQKKPKTEDKKEPSSEEEESSEEDDEEEGESSTDDEDTSKKEMSDDDKEKKAPSSPVASPKNAPLSPPSKKAPSPKISSPKAPISSPKALFKEGDNKDEDDGIVNLKGYYPAGTIANATVEFVSTKRKEVYELIIVISITNSAAPTQMNTLTENPYDK